MLGSGTKAFRGTTLNSPLTHISGLNKYSPDEVKTRQDIGCQPFTQPVDQGNNSELIFVSVTITPHTNRGSLEKVLGTTLLFNV
ncbi:hypothetical protein FD32_GL000399 [Limosilactobacillus panis DSM 6035]|uniref:Uncharacterized protein n=1 Tax=Limosilactobacillus panis DSM 6035 TaxID=1423782 RepID=A0A0R1XU32_9LACO|nr:hypothetical protein FD32_GL000399 [Limosilactobacillus panis DSM 6035]